MVYDIVSSVIDQYSQLIVKWTADMNQLEHQKVSLDGLRALQTFFMSWVDRNRHINRDQVKILTTKYMDIYDFVCQMYPNASMNDFYYFEVESQTLSPSAPYDDSDFSDPSH